jgi:hypothetical protein
MSPAYRKYNDSSRKVTKSIKMPKEVKYRGYTKLTAARGLLLMRNTGYERPTEAGSIKNAECPFINSR